MGVDLIIYVGKSMEEMNVKYSVQAVRNGAAILRKTVMIYTQRKDLSLGPPQPKRKEREGELTGEDLGARAWRKGKKARREPSPYPGRTNRVTTDRDRFTDRDSAEESEKEKEDEREYLAALEKAEQIK